MPGMLLHIDGSKHRWLNDDRWYDLIVILDDATSEIYYAQLVEEESTRTVMAGLREVIETHGTVLLRCTATGGAIFFLTAKEGEKVDKHRLTQVGRAMKETGGTDDRGLFAAGAGQKFGAKLRDLARGACPQELRLAGINGIAEANRFLREQYITEFNSKFRVPAARKKAQHFGEPAGRT